jgi:hypothetical protein
MMEEWRKSPYSGNQGNCVEVHHTLGAVRDSKNIDGPALRIPLSAMHALTDFARRNSTAN